MHRHAPVNCFVPPHILKNIATNGTAGQRSLAIDTLKLSAQMRGKRQALGERLAKIKPLGPTDPKAALAAFTVASVACGLAPSAGLLVVALAARARWLLTHGRFAEAEADLSGKYTVLSNLC